MNTDWVFLAAVASVLFVLGMASGFLLADSTYRRALIHLCQFAIRMVYKAFVRTIDSLPVQRLVQADMEQAVLSMEEKLKRADPAALEAADLLRNHLKEIYGEELSAVYFFGSRMRGNHTVYSDVDMVMFFRPTVSFAHARSQVRREVFHVLLQYGLLIQPHLAYDGDLGSLDVEAHPMIRRAVQTGIPIG